MISDEGRSINGSGRPEAGIGSDPSAGLIMGLAAGYHYGDVRPFLQSLEHTGYTGRCVLFVSPTTRQTESIAGHGAEVVPFERDTVRGGRVAHLPYNAVRFFLYRDFLETCGTVFPKILVTDVRDVIFQRDPLGFAWPEGLSITLEDRRMRVEDCPYMRRWTTDHLGEKAWRDMADRPISCSGTVVGDHDAMLGYLDRMLERLLPHEAAKGMAGYDQGVHNHLLYDGAFGTVSTFDNYGPILTLGYREGEPERGHNGEILAENGEPAVIVHQYDRHPKLFREVRERFA